jgi:hypothetical protein
MAGRSGPHHRNSDVVIDEGGAGEIVLRDIFVGLVSDVERARAKHDAHGAYVMKVNEIAPTRQAARLRKRHAVRAGDGDCVPH